MSAAMDVDYAVRDMDAHSLLPEKPAQGKKKRRRLLISNDEDELGIPVFHNDVGLSEAAVAPEVASSRKKDNRDSYSEADMFSSGTQIPSSENSQEKGNLNLCSEISQEKRNEISPLKNSEEKRDNAIVVNTDARNSPQLNTPSASLPRASAISRDENENGVVDFATETADVKGLSCFSLPSDNGLVEGESSTGMVGKAAEDSSNGIIAVATLTEKVVENVSNEGTMGIGVQDGSNEGTRGEDAEYVCIERTGESIEDPSTEKTNREGDGCDLSTKKDEFREAACCESVTGEGFSQRGISCADDREVTVPRQAVRTDTRNRDVSSSTGNVENRTEEASIKAVFRGHERFQSSDEASTKKGLGGKMTEAISMKTDGESEKEITVVDEREAAVPSKLKDSECSKVAPDILAENVTENVDSAKEAFCKNQISIAEAVKSTSSFKASDDESKRRTSSDETEPSVSMKVRDKEGQRRVSSGDGKKPSIPSIPLKASDKESKKRSSSDETKPSIFLKTSNKEGHGRESSAGESESLKVVKERKRGIANVEVTEPSTSLKARDKEGRKMTSGSLTANDTEKRKAIATSPTRDFKERRKIDSEYLKANFKGKGSDIPLNCGSKLKEVKKTEVHHDTKQSRGLISNQSKKPGLLENKTRSTRPGQGNKETEKKQIGKSHNFIERRMGTSNRVDHEDKDNQLLSEMNKRRKLIVGAEPKGLNQKGLLDRKLVHHSKESEKKDIAQKVKRQEFKPETRVNSLNFEESLDEYLRNDTPRRNASTITRSTKIEKKILKTQNPSCLIHVGCKKLIYGSKAVHGGNTESSKLDVTLRNTEIEDPKESSNVNQYTRKKSRLAVSSPEGQSGATTPVQPMEKTSIKSKEDNASTNLKTSISKDQDKNGFEQRVKTEHSRSEPESANIANFGNDSTTQVACTKSDGSSTPTSAANSDVRGKRIAQPRGGKEISRLDKSKKRVLVREEAIKTLLNAGWTIEHRPRRGKNYEDSVYISPSGTSLWSLPKAWDVWKKTAGINEDEDPSNTLEGGRISTSDLKSPASLDLSLLKRKRRKKQGTQNDPEVTTSKRRKIVKNQGENSDFDEKGRVDKRLKANGPDSHMEKSRGSEKSRANMLHKHKGSTSDVKKHVKTEPIDGEVQKSHNKKDQSDGRRHLSRKQRVSASNVVRISSQGKKNKHRGAGYGLFVRSSGKGATGSTGEAVNAVAKRTVLSWLLDSGVVSEEENVQYWNKKGTVVMLDGWVDKNGIYCECCSSVVSATEFASHAGKSQLSQPFENVYLLSGKSWTQCLMEAWDKEDETKKSGRYVVEVDEDDQNDDTCCLCGDGGDLICCDKCPSTFHKDCLGLEDVPDGDWYCLSCTCRICGKVGCQVGEATDNVLFCEQCEHHYHKDCLNAETFRKELIPSNPSCFCSQTCEGVSECLKSLLGVKNDLEGGFSWTLIRLFDEAQLNSSTEQQITSARMAECNAKLAVAYRVMDECFIPIIDPRTNINMVSHVVYSCWSNFPRLNYKGFYTLVLEKNDEFISVASIRIHGTQLAEMPLIGTRHHYRRQGMCRRLVNAIEGIICYTYSLAPFELLDINEIRLTENFLRREAECKNINTLFSHLHSFQLLLKLGVHKFILPAIPELMATWTKAFGFKPLNNIDKEEIRSMNLMVFPGTDLLKKEMFTKEPSEATNLVDVQSMLPKRSTSDENTENENGNGPLKNLQSGDPNSVLSVGNQKDYSSEKGGLLQ